MSYFSIAAPQTVVLPNGTQLHFRVNPADSSQVELHVTGERDGAEGTWVIPMRRNAGAAGIPEFSATAQPATDQPPNAARIAALPDDHPIKADLQRRQEAADNGVALDADGQPTGAPPPPDGEYPSLASYGSVNDDAVRSATGDAKVDPVHGRINTVGMDQQPAKPKEGRNEDTPLSDRRDHASVGLKSDSKPA